MPSTWNRNVDFDAAGDVLVVTKGAPNPPPPPPPAGQTRNDTARRIDVYKVDRGGGGARIKYHAKDGKDAKGKTIKVKLTGIALKVGKPYRGGRIYVRVSPAGKVMTLRITKDSDKPGFTGTKGDENWDYYVQGTANDTVKQTKDPRIRNRAL